MYKNHRYRWEGKSLMKKDAVNMTSTADAR